MGRLYELVVRHFLATLSHDARFLQTKVLLSSTSGESFTVSGKIMIDPGYLAVLLQSKVGLGGVLWMRVWLGEERKVLAIYSLLLLFFKCAHLPYIYLLAYSHRTRTSCRTSEKGSVSVLPRLLSAMGRRRRQAI